MPSAGAATRRTSRSVTAPMQRSTSTGPRPGSESYPGTGKTRGQDLRWTKTRTSASMPGSVCGPGGLEPDQAVGYPGGPGDCDRGGVQLPLGAACHRGTKSREGDRAGTGEVDRGHRVPAAGEHGPLWVRGGIPVMSADGKPYAIRNRVTLCRCGKSGNKPFCDGSRIGRVRSG